MENKNYDVWFASINAWLLAIWVVLMGILLTGCGTDLYVGGLRIESDFSDEDLELIALTMQVADEVAPTIPIFQELKATKPRNIMRRNGISLDVRARPIHHKDPLGMFNLWGTNITLADEADEDVRFLVLTETLAHEVAHAMLAARDYPESLQQAHMVPGVFGYHIPGYFEQRPSFAVEVFERLVAITRGSR